jgi:hypothetical protein
MVQSCGKEHLERQLEAGGPRDADTDGEPMVMAGGRLIAGEVMGGVASPITSAEGEAEREKRGVGTSECRLSGRMQTSCTLSTGRAGRDLSETPDPDCEQRH